MNRNHHILPAMSPGNPLTCGADSSDSGYRQPLLYPLCNITQSIVTDAEFYWRVYLNIIFFSKQGHIFICEILIICVNRISQTINIRSIVLLG